MISRLYISLVALCFVINAVQGQENSVSLSTAIKGAVRDSSQAAIPNATVELSSNVAPTQTASTDVNGEFAFTGLRSGTYQVNVSFQGFEPFESEVIQLQVGQTVQQNVTLNPAGTKTVTDVTANAAQVEISDPAVYNTLSSKEVQNLQLNGRNFVQLIALTPGVSNQTGQDEASVGVKGSAAFSVNGGRTEYNTFDLDGSDLLNVGFNGGVNTLMVYPSLDAIGEIKILTSNYGAMYGRTASGTVLVTTKAGTNAFHGNLYYFVRNEAFNARNFFDQTRHAPLYRRNDVGGTIGGPLYIPGLYNTQKDKTFFFFSEEYRTEKTPTQFNQGVPSTAERNGNFSDVCPTNKQLYKLNGQGYFFRDQAPVGYQNFPDCPTQFPTPIIVDPNSGPAYPAYLHNQIFSPGNNFLSPNAAAILGSGIIPYPNATSGCNSSINSCFNTTVSLPTHWREELFRIDHYFNQNNRFMLRFVHDSWDTVTPAPQYGVINNNLPTIYNNFTGPGVNVVARLSQTLSPTLVNEVFATYGNSKITLQNANGLNSQYQRPSALNSPCSPLGNGDTTGVTQCMGYLFNNGFGNKQPGLRFVGNSAYGGGFAVDSGYMPWDHTNPTWTFGDTVSKVWGKHYLQTGVEFIFAYRKQTNSVSGSATGDTQGILTYTAASGSGNAFADFLIQTAQGHNTLNSFQQDSAQLQYRQRYTIAEPYVQDDWKVNSRLTVNLGLRLSLFGLYHETNYNAYNWEASAYDPVLASQVTIQPAGAYGAGALATPDQPFSVLGTYTPIFFNPGEMPPPQLLNGTVRCGYNKVPVGCMDDHLVNPAPRIGFAWDPIGDGKTSIRGGYGIFFEHGTGNEANTGALEGSAPAVLSMSTSANPSLTCIGPANQAYCNPRPSSEQAGEILALPLNVTSIQTKALWPYVQQWSFSVQRELPQHTIATLAYVGSKGTHLTAETQTNSLHAVPASQNPFGANEPLTRGDCTQQAIPGTNTLFYQLLNGAQIFQDQPAYNNISIACGQFNPNAAGPLINSLRPYLGIGQIVALNNVANSSYNALQFSAHHSTGPLTVGLSYTWSHSLDNSSDRFDPIPNAYDIRSNRASSNFDQRHLLNISYIYDIPAPSKSTWLSNTILNGGGTQHDINVLDAVFGNWQISGITIFQSGIPFSVINYPSNGAADNAGVANGIGTFSLQSYPDVVGDPNGKPAGGVNAAGTIGPLLANPGAFVTPRGLTFGDAGRNSLNNPSRLNFDVSLFKHFKTGERFDWQLRAEAFNIFNTTQFELYNPGKGNQPNNEITCYGGSNFSAGDPSCLVGNAFLHPVDAHRPRTIQLALKFSF